MIGLNLLILVLFVFTWLWAPFIQSRAGHHDEAAWVQLFMIPTGVIGLVICGVGFVATSRGLLIAAGIVLMIHLAIGAGLHPR